MPFTWQRRVSAFIQDRVGPNRVGPFGLLQPLADAVKSFLKEDFTPDHVRKAYFWLAPAIVMIPSLLTVAVIPFGSNLGDAADGHCRPERRHSLHVRHRLAGSLWNRAGRLRLEFEVSVPRRHPLQRPDDFLRNRHGPVRHSPLHAGGRPELEPGHWLPGRAGLGCGNRTNHGTTLRHLSLVGFSSSPWLL